MSSVDVILDDAVINVAVNTPNIIVQTSGPPGPGGGGGGGSDFDQADADLLYVKIAGIEDQHVESSLDIYGDMSAMSGYFSGAVDVNEKISSQSLRISNGTRLDYAAQIRRTDPALTSEDPEIFVIYYGTGTSDNERASWSNEKGQWRTSNIPAPGEDALKVIGATTATGNMIVATKQDGTIVFRVGPNGTTIAELGLRLVAGAAVGRVLVGDAAGNATWQAVPCATGASPPASPYVGQLWADPN